MTGPHLKNAQKPVNLTLNDKILPWVNNATHLGNELHMDAHPDFDCNIKRARFIDSSLQIKETFSFAEPREILKAILIYCCDFYGSPLWNLYGAKAEQLYRCWNICVKLCWDLPRNTHNIYVRNFLSCNFPSIRTQCISRYTKYYKSLLSCPSKEVMVMARLVRFNALSTTGLNALNIRIETGRYPWEISSREAREILSSKEKSVDSDVWRCWLLNGYIEIRNNLRAEMENTEYIENLIESLCTS